jgi:N-acetylglucosamine kinase-like BadF-type ATPase
MKYFFGMDIGGTKSHALIADENGTVVGFGRSGPGNWEGVGYDGLQTVLEIITAQAVEMAGIERAEIAGAGFGIAGYDWPSQRQPHLEVIQTLGLNGPIELVNDAALGIPAGTKEGWGVSIVSGTGCNGRGWNADRSREGRAVGGHGHWSDEAAGGYDIMLRAMRAISFEWTRRGPATALTPAFLQKHGAPNLDEFVEGVYLDHYNFDVSDIMLVFEIAKQGDPEALNVMRWAGDQLGQIAVGVIRQVGLENEACEVVQIGSLYEGHPLISEQMHQTIRQVATQAQLVRLTAPPVIGGVLLGMEALLGKAAYQRRARILATIGEATT